MMCKPEIVVIDSQHEAMCWFNLMKEVLRALWSHTQMIVENGGNTGIVNNRTASTR